MTDAPERKPSHSQSDGDATLARSRLANPWWFHVVFVVALGAQIGAAVTSRSLIPLAMLPLLVFCWLLLLFLRVTVTTRHVRVQYGVFRADDSPRFDPGGARGGLPVREVWRLGDARGDGREPRVLRAGTRREGAR